MFPLCKKFSSSTSSAALSFMLYALLLLYELVLTATKQLVAAYVKRASYCDKTEIVADD
jgi:hypothetical protein